MDKPRFRQRFCLLTAAGMALSAGFLAAGPAEAAMAFTASHGFEGAGHDSIDWTTQALAPWTDIRCGSGSCYATSRVATPDQGLSVRLFQDSHDQGQGFSMVAMRGTVTVHGPSNGADVNAHMNLRFADSSSVSGGTEFSHAVATAMAWVSADGRNATWTTERSLVPGECGCNGSPEPGGVNMVLSPAGALTASLQLPVGRPFELSLSLYAWGRGSFIERTDGRYALGLVAGQTFFELPGGYSVQSADWSVADNRWCGAGCGTPPVPEPATAALWAAGLIALVRRLHTRRNPQGLGDLS